jgi:hypothetical protein
MKFKELLESYENDKINYIKYKDKRNKIKSIKNISGKDNKEFPNGKVQIRAIIIDTDDNEYDGIFTRKPKETSYTMKSGNAKLNESKLEVGDKVKYYIHRSNLDSNFNKMGEDVIGFGKIIKKNIKEVDIYETKEVVYNIELDDGKIYKNIRSFDIEKI